MTTDTLASAATRENELLPLPEGRLVGYAEYGDPNGKPLFFFHGYPGTRLLFSLAHDAARAAGARIIALDRPGIGLSGYQPKRRLADWPTDVIALADALGIERFVVAGMSGGGPYAAACARFIPERLNGCALVSGVAPFDVPGITDDMMRTNQWLFRIATWPGPALRVVLKLQGAAMRRWPDRVVATVEKALPEADRAIFARPEVQAAVRRDLAEAQRSGTRGVTHEGRLYPRPWGFRLEDIAMKVHVWQGGADVNVPPAMGRYQADAIPNAELHFYENEGHLLAVDRFAEIANAIIN